MCHITGGGLLNFNRLTRYGFDIDRPLLPPEIFRWIKEQGAVDDHEMYRTFNMGMGYAFIAPEKSYPAIKEVLHDAAIIGRIIGEPGIWLRGEPFF